MGDYTKVIVNCSLKKMSDKDAAKLEEEILEMAGTYSSAYHCGGELIKIQNDWHHRSDLTFVTQMKYSRGLDEFIDWLRPQVIEGMGECDAFAMSFTEYQKEPTVYYKEQIYEE
jgi:hypothetical protein